MNYKEYMELKDKSRDNIPYFTKIAIDRYEMWLSNAIKRVERAREIGKKIRACTIIQRKFIEYMYKPNGLCASELALHYQLLWAVREEMRQVNNI